MPRAYAALWLVGGPSGGGFSKTCLVRRCNDKAAVVVLCGSTRSVGCIFFCCVIDFATPAEREKIDAGQLRCYSVLVAAYGDV